MVSCATLASCGLFVPACDSRETEVLTDRQLLFGTLIWAALEIAAATLLWPAGAIAAAPDAAVSDWSAGIDAERWQLPEDETAGFVGLHLRRDFTPHLRAGIDSFAAVEGDRGGFITIGVGGEYVRPIYQSLDIEAGVSLTAGGGRGGFELSGGGLMTRESLGLGLSIGDWRIRTGVSRVDFPNGGTIHSTQWYAGIERAFQALSAPLDDEGGRFRLTESTRFTAADFGVFGRQYFVQSSSRTASGVPQLDFGLVGAEWRGTLDGPWYYSVDAGGAARGDSNGYMEIMGGIGLRLPLSDRIAVDASAAVGAGGGGDVDTGGGVLLAARAGAEFRITGRDSVALGYERMWAPDGDLTADGVSLGLRHRFGPDQSRTAADGSRVDLEAHDVRIRIAGQQYNGSGSEWSTRPIPDIGVLGVQIDYFLSPRFCLTGQGLAAADGKSGAYMTGLVGAGLRLPTQAHIDFEAEALVGAAGGGGVAVGSGAVGQLSVGIGHEWSNGVGVHASYGRMEALNDGFSVDVVGVSFSYRMKMLTASR